jgi:hypothetical protein
VTALRIERTARGADIEERGRILYGLRMEGEGDKKVKE